MLNEEDPDTVHLREDVSGTSKRINWREHAITVGLLFTLVLVVIVLIIAFTVSYATSPKTIRARNGAVAADNTDCSAMGVTILEKGGNAVDAAVITGLCLGVRQPFASGIGGGGFMLVHFQGSNEYIDFRDVAPAAAHKLMYVNRTEDSKTGGLAVAVPGELRGYYDAHSKYGKLPWKQVVMPVVSMARDGFKVGKAFQDSIESHIDVISKFPALHSIVSSENGNLLRQGDVLKRPKLADTLERVAEDGADAFYTGSIAQSIIKTIKENGGIITEQDFANYTIRTGPAMHTQYRGYNTYIVPPPSSGIVTAAALNIIEQFMVKENVTDSFGELGAGTHHVIVETLKHVFAHRMHLGDPAYVDVDWVVQRLMNSKYIKDLSSSIHLNNTFPPEYYFVNQSIETETDHGTSHFSIVDKDRNAVSVTTTVNFSFGSKVLDLKTGVLLNDQMNDFTVTPNKPNGFDLPPTKANFIAPGKRPLSSMSPTILTDKNDHFVMAIGASGGPTIISAVLESAINMLEFGLEPLDAIAAPRYHSQLIPDHVGCEDTLSGVIREALERRHHKLVEPSVLPDGHSVGVCQVVYERDVGTLMAASDPRKHGTAAGY